MQSMVSCHGNGARSSVETECMKTSRFKLAYAYSMNERKLLSSIYGWKGKWAEYEYPSLGPIILGISWSAASRVWSSTKFI